MTIQFNTDNTISGTETVTAPFTAQISDALSRFSSHITRIEVHLGDENGHKAGINDIRCMIQARMEGKQPIAVTNHAGTTGQAVSGAIDKLKASLDTIIGRDRKY